jgi:hypothetical protein
MDTKRVLGLALSAVALALIVWGLWFAKFPVDLFPFKVSIVTEPN